VLKVNAGDDFDSDDCRNHPVDHKTERRPPPRVGHEVTAVLAQILDSVASQADDKQPRRAP
jgi:hypothetical protein